VPAATEAMSAVSGELVLVAVAISLDNLAAALALGTRTPGSARLRVAVVFATFGGLAPIVGVAVGRTISTYVAAWASAISVGALGGIGLVTIIRAARRSDIESPPDPLRIPALLLLGATLSTDNLAVGFGLGLRGASPLIIGGLASLMVFLSSYLGLVAGRGGFRRWGRFAEFGAGILLIAVAAGFARLL
jgi:manganese efflux pump family protein